MDINLKHNMSGIEAVKVIREINEYETVPIVAMTAFAMQKDKEEFLAKGCSHFIAKPFTKEEILGLMEEILHQNMN
jgi:CheY-like chemotaxis protein